MWQTLTVSFVAGSERLLCVKSCRTVINKKPHLCGGVRQSMLAEWSINNFPSALRAFNNHSASAPLKIHHFPLRSSLTDIRNTALRLKYQYVWNITVLFMYIKINKTTGEFQSDLLEH